MPTPVVRRPLPGWWATYGPREGGPFPGVLLLHGSEGGMAGWSHRNAVMLAAAGFLAYPHAYSTGGNPWNAGAIEKVELTRTAEALDALRADPACDGRVAVYGVSRGAEHALLLAALMAREAWGSVPDAVACLAAPDVVCGAFDGKVMRDFGDPGWRAWDPAERAWLWKGESDGLSPTTPIPIEAYEGPLFLAVGLEDQVWSAEMTRRLEMRRRAHGRSVEAIYYENEGHALGNDAENDHYDQLIAFLRRTLGGEG